MARYYNSPLNFPNYRETVQDEFEHLSTPPWAERFGDYMQNIPEVLMNFLSQPRTATSRGNSQQQFQQNRNARVLQRANTEPRVQTRPTNQLIPTQPPPPRAISPDQIATDNAITSLRIGEEAANTQNMQNMLNMENTLLGQVDIPSLMQSALQTAGDIYSSDPVQNIIDLGPYALAQPARFGDWGLEPFARAKVARDTAAAEAQQQILLEQIKVGPTGMIDASWKADIIKEVSKFSGARRLMDEMRKLAGDQVGGVLQTGAKFFNDLGDILAIPAVGLNPQEHMNAMRAQLIAYLSGAFGREISKAEHKLINKMLPTAKSSTSSQDFLDALDTFQSYIDNELAGAMSVAKEGGFGQAAENTREGATYSLIGQTERQAASIPTTTAPVELPLGPIGDSPPLGGT